MYLVRRFYPGSSDDDPTHPKVAIATGFAASGGLELQTLAGLAGTDAAALVSRATANTSQGPRKWNVEQKSGLLFKKPSLLRAYGDMAVSVRAMETDGGGVDDLSSDLILDEAFVAEACKLLRGVDLIAAIPKRGWLMVAKGSPGELPVMLRFGELAKGMAGRGGRHALTVNCYFLRDGALRGVSGDGYVSLLTVRDNAWNLP